MLALDYSGERSQRLPITAAMTIATITPLMRVRLDLRFGIGAIPIRATTLRYPNARSPGAKLFSDGLETLAPVLRPFGNVGRRYRASPFHQKGNSQVGLARGTWASERVLLILSY